MFIQGIRNAFTKILGIHMNTQVHTPGYAPAGFVPLLIVFFLFFLKEIVDRVLNDWIEPLRALIRVVCATVPI